MSDTLEHKGYSGSVEFSAEDEVFHGRLLGIRDRVTFEGTDVRGLKRNFKAAVDEYFAFCKAEGKEPNVPFRGTFNVRIGPELHKRAALYAEENGKRLNRVVVEAVEEFLEQASS
jgi:predicted HicB family RNase H-like nuclease